jgi:hypothetical protein
MTGTTSLFRLSAISFLLVSGILQSSAKGQAPDTMQQPGVKFTGLTQTLTNLLKTRTQKSFILGEYEIFLEDLIDDDVSGVFDCDSVVIQYLSTTDVVPTYEGLTYEMSSFIESRFVYDDGYLYVNILADTTKDGMYFNISVTRGKPIRLPVVLQASDTSFSTSFDTTLTAVFNADIDLYVNVEMANAGEESRATRVRINTFSFEITTHPDEDFTYIDCYDSEQEESEDFYELIGDSSKFIPFETGGIQYCAVPRCFSIYAKTYWYLNPDDEEHVEYEEGVDTELTFEQIEYEEGVNPALTFEQIEKGAFRWDESHLGYVKADLLMLPADEEWDSLLLSKNHTEFQYIVDDLFDEFSLEQISLCCGIDVHNGVTVRNKKYVLKP